MSKTKKSKLATINGVDLSGKLVVMKEHDYIGTERERTFKCEGGFGCNPRAMGSAVFGYFVNNPKQPVRVERYEIEGLAPVQAVPSPTESPS